MMASANSRVEAKLFSVMNSGEVAEEALDQIHPGGRGRRVMHVKAGVAIEPSGDRGMFMGGVIVGDDVDGEIARGLVIDGFEKGQPLLMAVAWRQTGDQLALEIVERGKQRQRAMSHVIVGLGANVADPQWQTRLRALQCLALCFLVAA